MLPTGEEDVLWAEKGEFDRQQEWRMTSGRGEVRCQQGWRMTAGWEGVRLAAIRGWRMTAGRGRVNLTVSIRGRG